MDDELLYPPTPPALDVPQELILGIAVGMEDPDEVASRYGFDGARWERLQKWKPFNDAVAKQRSELEASGMTFRIKAKALTEDVFEDAYKIARSNDATLLQKLEFIKLGAKLGDMEPKTNTAIASGPGFSITINMGEVSKKSQNIDISAEHVQEVEEIKQIEQSEALEQVVQADKPKKKKKVKASE
jgi:hypothetical protein